MLIPHGRILVGTTLRPPIIPRLFRATLNVRSAALKDCLCLLFGKKLSPRKEVEKEQEASGACVASTEASPPTVSLGGVVAGSPPRQPGARHVTSAGNAIATTGGATGQGKKGKRLEALVRGWEIQPRDEGPGHYDSMGKFHRQPIR